MNRVSPEPIDTQENLFGIVQIVGLDLDHFGGRMDNKLKIHRYYEYKDSKPPEYILSASNLIFTTYPQPTRDVYQINRQLLITCFASQRIPRGYQLSAR